MQEGFIDSEDGDALVDDPDRIEGYRSVGLADGLITGSDSEQLKAWTYLVESGKAWELQGWFARRAIELLTDRKIEANGKPLPTWVRQEVERRQRLAGLR